MLPAFNLALCVNGWLFMLFSSRCLFLYTLCLYTQVNLLLFTLFDGALVGPAPCVPALAMLQVMSDIPVLGLGTRVVDE
uniref:Uncharacterized protein n=1 Tax=Ixodes ricinus TaxID=34613 RepID=A0A6B0U5F0_IXORI